MPPKLTGKTLAVLGELLQDPSQPRYGLEISENAGISTTTVYDILMKLEHSGWVTSRWESIAPKEAGRPRRRLYRLTGLGEKSARDAVESEIEKLSRARRSTEPKPAEQPSRAPVRSPRGVIA